MYSTKHQCENAHVTAPQHVSIYWVLEAYMLYILEFYFGMREEVSTVFSSLGIFKVSIRVCI